MKLSTEFNCWYTAWHRFESGELALFQEHLGTVWRAQQAWDCSQYAIQARLTHFSEVGNLKPRPATCPQGQTGSQDAFYFLCIDIETNFLLTSLWLTLWKPKIYGKYVEIRESSYLLGVYFGDWGGMRKMWQSSSFKSNLNRVRPILLLPTNNSICCILYKPFYYWSHSYQLGSVISSMAQPSITFCSWTNVHSTACLIYLLPVIQPAQIT